MLGSHSAGALVSAVHRGAGARQVGFRHPEAPFPGQSGSGFQFRPVSDVRVAPFQVKNGPKGFRPDPDGYLHVLPGAASDVS